MERCLVMWLSWSLMTRTECNVWTRPPCQQLLPDYNKQHGLSQSKRKQKCQAKDNHHNGNTDRGRPNFGCGFSYSAELPLKWLSARFRPSFRYSRKWNLVSAGRRRLIALLSGPSLKWLRHCNMTAVLSSVRQWPYIEHVTAHISLLSKPTTS